MVVRFILKRKDMNTKLKFDAAAIRYVLLTLIVNLLVDASVASAALIGCASGSTLVASQGSPVSAASSPQQLLPSALPATLPHFQKVLRYLPHPPPPLHQRISGLAMKFQWMVPGTIISGSL